MSEEVLKALMQLFAIIGNQDSGAGDVHRKYVHAFLKSQISEDRLSEFMDYYLGFIKPREENEESAKRTSMKDSVRTLSICKKINKTLNQKQKLIVFVRLMEFIREDGEESALRSEIVKTVYEVFNISREEFGNISKLLSPDVDGLSAKFLRLHDAGTAGGECKEITVPGFDGECVFYYNGDANIVFMVYRGHAEVHLNGLVVTPSRVHVFPSGSAIRHIKGTVFYSDIISRFINEAMEGAVRFRADIAEHRHPNGKMALRDISISEKTGTLFGIMGASGSGKTTLLNVLSGSDRPTQGSVLINGKDVHAGGSEISGVIGFIPQDDLLIEELTVFQNLYLSARLCFKNVSEKELGIKVIKLLNSLGLYEARDIKVGNPLNKKISGGQRKRLNIALELIREPQVLFVDEPTSGLSSKDSENVMDLLKELSHKGKLIFVVIHQPSSDVYKLFDKILFLDNGGYPVYYGNPVEAVIYFKRATNQVNSHVAECRSCGSVNPELIFNLLEAKEIDEYGNDTPKRKISPEGWYTLYRESRKNRAEENAAESGSLRKLQTPGRFKQWWIFLLRDFFSKIANAQYILINLLEVPALAAVLAFLIRYADRFSSGGGKYSYYQNENIPAFYFMVIVVAMLVGLTVSAEEIFKDQKILKREKFLHLSRFSYLLSKLVILFSISALQSVILCLIGMFILKIPGGFLPIALVTFSVFCAANLMGLILSSTFNSPVTIYIIIPLVIIPQMLLGGAMFRFSKLNDLLGGNSIRVPPVSNLMVSRWAYESLMVTAFEDNKYESQIFPLDKLESKLNYKVSYAVPKVEELIEKLKKQDSVLKPEEKRVLAGTIARVKRQLVTELKADYDFVMPGGEEDTLSAVREFLTEKHNFIIDKKEKEQDRLNALGITKEKYSNKYMEELLTNAFEKKKIILDSAAMRFIQVIDPVFTDPVAGSTGLDTHFFAPYKVVFGKKVSTFSYNMAALWLLNFICFLLLYFDLFKRMIAMTGKISSKLISSTNKN